MKNVFQALLIIAAIVMAYITIDSPFQKIRFEEEKDLRSEKVISRLIDIRTAQVEYKTKYGRYTGSFDTLIDFVKNDSTPFIYKEGFLTDSMIEAGMTELKAVKLGILVRDTIFKPVYSEIYENPITPDSLRYVPTLKNVEFEMASGEIYTQSGVSIQVFEAKTPYKTYLAGLDEQEIDNLIAFSAKYERYPGMMVGSLEDANNNAGNWE